MEHLRGKGLQPGETELPDSSSDAGTSPIDFALQRVVMSHLGDQAGLYICGLGHMCYLL